MADFAMETWIALLRAVNVGGSRGISMARLRDLATELGLAEPRTLLQSGTVAVKADRNDGPEVDRLLGREAKKRLDLDQSSISMTAPVLASMTISMSSPAASVPSTS